MDNLAVINQKIQLIDLKSFCKMPE